MSDTPSENTLTANTTVQQLESTRSLFHRRTATIPTRSKEEDLGYDVKLEYAYQPEFQYKRPRNLERHDFVSFDLGKDDHQRNMLCMRNSVRQAFYALPTITSYGRLHETLSQTIFIDVYALEPYTSVIRTPHQIKNHRGALPTDWPCNSLICGKVHKNHGDYWYPIRYFSVYDWERFVLWMLTDRLNICLRKDGNIRREYENKRRRLYCLLNLYRDGKNPDGTYLISDGGVNVEYNEEYAEELVRHVYYQRNRFAAERDLSMETENFSEIDLDQVDPAEYSNSNRDEVHENIIKTIESLSDSPNPALAFLRRAQAPVFEYGANSEDLTI